MNKRFAGFTQLQLDEEGQRSVQRRGLLGHYAAGAYRTIVRPIAVRLLIARAKALNFLWGMDSAATFVQHQPSRYQNALLRAFGATVADDAIIKEGILLINTDKAAFRPLKIGRHVFLAHRLVIDLADEVIFGDCCTVSYGTQFLTHVDVGHSPLKHDLFPVQIAPIRIGRGAFIGPGVIVTRGVSIGECSVIGANSVVMRDIPPYSLAAGAPAKIIRELDRFQIPPFDLNETFIIPEGTTL